jgi:hypothetical protein
MVAFRKVLPVLALVVMMASLASAQTFSCQANAGVPPILRSEGLAEPVGDLVLNCTGGPDGVTTPTYVNVQIFLSTNVTSNVLGGNLEAVLLIDDPAPAAQCLGTPLSVTGANSVGTCAANLWLGEPVTGSSNSVIWKGIPIIPPGSVGTRIIRITNVRANANGVPTGSFIPGTVNEYIAITGSTSISVGNQPQLVGYVQDSMTVTVGSAQAKQCSETSKDVNITFTEIIATAFRKKIETDNSESLVEVEQSTVGYNYLTESIFTNQTLVPGLGTAGKANQGTRFIVRFKNVQNGVAVSVPSVAESFSLKLYYVAGAASDGSGGTVDRTISGLKSISLASGAGYAVYEVVGTGAGTNGLSETQSFAVGVRYSWTTNIGSGVPGLGVGQMSGGYGPSPIIATNTASATAPEPRFKEKFTEGDALTITACRTILLWPYITNQIGFDTGIVVSNTSSDPLGSNSQRQQQGACTLYFYGSTTGGGAAPSAQTTQVIPTGQQLTFTLSGGGTYGAPGAPGFQGYMFAICDFQYAHGYAFVTKMGAVDIAHGYLALVVPDRTTRDAKAFSMDAATNQGEQLGY